MDYSKFVNSVEKQDSRNIIKRVERHVSDIPKQLLDFLNQYDLLDVEIAMKDLSSVRMYPYSYLHQLQSEYNLGKEYFVFATKNSDPIAVFNQQIVTFAHGSCVYENETIATSFDDYICKLVEDIK